MPVPAPLRPAVVRALPETIDVKDSSFHQSLKRADISWNYNFQADCSMIVGLDRILESAESDAILSWLALDPRFDPAMPHVFATTAKGRKDGKAIFRAYGESLPDLVRASIAGQPWLACRDAAHHAPNDAMVQPGRLTDIFDVPRPAAVGSDEAFGLTQQIWRRGLAHAQVPFDLSDLTSSQVVSLLRSLSGRNLSADVVRHLYLQILALEAFDGEAASKEIGHFLAKGRVQVHRRHMREWVAPGKALYADNNGFPLAAREHLPLIDLPPRRNSGDVLERFGVQALSKQNFSLVVTQVEQETGHLASLLTRALTDAKPYIRALRRASSSETQRLKRFDGLELRIARSARIEVTIGDQKIEGNLEPWTHVLQGDVLTVAIEVHWQPAQLAALAHEAIADGIAELFEIQSGAEFLKLLSAEEPELRRLLLRRVLPNLSDDEIDGLLIDAGAAEEDYEPVRVDAAILARGPAPTPPKVVPGVVAAAIASQPGAPAAHIPVAGAAKPGALEAVKLEGGGAPNPPQASPAKAPPGIRVAPVTGPISSTANHDPGRAGDAESWVLLFEIGQGRVPLDVSHIQGREAYGCDCLSFASEDDLARFRETPTLTDLVCRFIETKSGGVHLTGSEVMAARKRGDRYFVYRVEFYSGSRSFAELTIAKNPLSHLSSLVTQCELRIDTVASRERYKLTPSSS